MHSSELHVSRHCTIGNLHVVRKFLSVLSNIATKLQAPCPRQAHLTVAMADTIPIDKGSKKDTFAALSLGFGLDQKVLALLLASPMDNLEDLHFYFTDEKEIAHSWQRTTLLKTAPCACKWPDSGVLGQLSDTPHFRGNAGNLFRRLQNLTIC